MRTYEEQVKLGLMGEISLRMTRLNLSQTWIGMILGLNQTVISSTMTFRLHGVSIDVLQYMAEALDAFEEDLNEFGFEEAFATSPERCKRVSQKYERAQRSVEYNAPRISRMIRMELELRNLT